MLGCANVQIHVSRMRSSRASARFGQASGEAIACGSEYEIKRRLISVLRKVLFGDVWTGKPAFFERNASRCKIIRPSQLGAA